MNDFKDIHDIDPVNPQRQVDLLVDGELSEAERRALLLQLEHEPDGWRRCAWRFWRPNAGRPN